MDLLMVDEYRYKDRYYTRDACKRDHGENRPEEA